MGPGAAGPWPDRSAGNIGPQAPEGLSGRFGIGIGEPAHGGRRRRGMAFSGGAYTGAGPDPGRGGYGMIGRRPYRGGVRAQGGGHPIGSRPPCAVRGAMGDRARIGKTGTGTVRRGKPIGDWRAVRGRLRAGGCRGGR